MARYFGGFRDRLKKKTRNLSLSEKDIEWLDVSTTFSWAPARRDYQWLEPEDYLSSFLNSSANEPDYSGVSAGDGIGENFDIYEREVDQGGDSLSQEEEDIGYVAPYDYTPNTPGDDTLTGSNVEIPADLPHLDEYKLEINSALQRRGIHVEPDHIKVPDELAFHLKNYHEKGRSNIDSYELRARLQNYKKQVIETYEYSSHGKSAFLSFEEEIKGVTVDESNTGKEHENLDTKDYESFIVSSLDRLEESMREEAVDPDAGSRGTKIVDASELKTGNEPPEIQTPFFSNPPSSFADDSWLVLPVDSAGSSNQDASKLDDSKKDLPDWDIFKKDQVNTKGPGGKSAGSGKKPKSLFKREEETDSNGILKALNTINSNLSDTPVEDDLDSPVEFFSNKTVSRGKKDEGGIGFDTPEKQASRDDTPDIPTRKRVALFQRSDAGKVGDLLKEEKLNSRLKEEPFAREKTRKEVTFKHNPSSDQASNESSRKEVRFPNVFSNDSKDKVNLNDEQSVEGEPTLRETPSEQFFADKNESEDPLKARRVEVKLNNRLKPDVISTEHVDHVSPSDEVKQVEEPRNITDKTETEAGLDEDTTLSDLLLRLRHEGDSSRKKTDLDEPAEVVEPLPEPVNEEFNREHKNFTFAVSGEAPETFGSQDEEEELRTVENIEVEADSEMEISPGGPVNETMEQRRARFIEEERKKLYSLIGRLEHSAENLEIIEEKEAVLDPGHEDVNEGAISDALEQALIETTGEEEVADSLHLSSWQNEEAQNEEIEEVADSSNLSSWQDEETEEVADSLNLSGWQDEETEEVADSLNLSGWQNEETEEVKDIEDLNGKESNDLEIEEETPILDTQIIETIPLVDPVPETTHHFEQSDTGEETEDTLLEENIVIPEQELQNDQIDAVFFSAQGSESSMNEEKVDMPQSQNSNDLTLVEEQISDIPQKEPELNIPDEIVTDRVIEVEETAALASREFDEVKPEGEQLPGVVECLAFAAEEPIPLKRIARIYSEVQGVRMPSEEEVMTVIEKLNEQYEKQGRSFRIKMWGRGIRMATHPQYAKYIRAIYQDNRPKKLSRTLMETLSIIAYSQPTTKPEIDFVRGVDSDYAVRKLLEIGLIDIVGRSDSIGRPLLYGTSERFLDQFGLSELEALPKLREVEELLGDPAFQKERLHLLALENMEEKESQSKGSNTQQEASKATDTDVGIQEPADDQTNS